MRKRKNPTDRLEYQSPQVPPGGHPAALPGDVGAPPAPGQPLQGEHGAPQYQIAQNNSGQYVPPNYDPNQPNGWQKKRPWWRRKLWKLPVWAWIGAVVFVFVVIQTKGGSNEQSASEAPATTAAVEATDAPHTSIGSTEPEATSADSPAPTVAPTTVPTVETTAAAQQTTVPTLSIEDIQTVFSLVFENQRGDIISIVEDDPFVESVDVLDYDGDAGVIRLEVTPAYDVEEGVRDDSWSLTRAFSAFYVDGGSWVVDDPAWSPTLDVKVSSAHYTCSGDQMRQIADSRFSREDWEAGCRVG